MSTWLRVGPSTVKPISRDASRSVGISLPCQMPFSRWVELVAWQALTHKMASGLAVFVENIWKWTAFSLVNIPSTTSRWNLHPSPFSLCPWLGFYGLTNVCEFFMEFVQKWCTPKTDGFPINNGYYWMASRYHHGHGQPHMLVATSPVIVG